MTPSAASAAFQYQAENSFLLNADAACQAPTCYLSALTGINPIGVSSGLARRNNGIDPPQTHAIRVTAGGAVQDRDGANPTVFSTGLGITLNSLVAGIRDDEGVTFLNVGYNALVGGGSPSALLGACATCRVGYTTVGGAHHAIYVKGGSNVVYDLHGYLPAALGAVSSEAYAALDDADKTVIGSFTDAHGFRRAFRLNAESVTGIGTPVGIPPALPPTWGGATVQIGGLSGGASAAFAIAANGANRWIVGCGGPGGLAPKMFVRPAAAPLANFGLSVPGYPGAGGCVLAVTYPTQMFGFIAGGEFSRGVSWNQFGQVSDVTPKVKFHANDANFEIVELRAVSGKTIVGHGLRAGQYRGIRIKPMVRLLGFSGLAASSYRGCVDDDGEVTLTDPVPVEAEADVGSELMPEIYVSHPDLVEITQPAFVTGESSDGITLTVKSPQASIPAPGVDVTVALTLAGETIEHVIHVSENPGGEPCP